jgi:HSP20 family protein
MAKIRRIPFKDLLFLQDRMSRAFDEAAARSGLGHARVAWCPPADIFETEDAIVVKVELPGVDLEDVKAELKEGVLELSGERKLKKNLKEEHFHRMETPYGNFRRVFNLPTNVDEKLIKAGLSDGVLEIKVPKTRMRKKKIKVEVK